MQISQRYILTIHDLFTMPGGVLCGADAEVAILDGGIEIDRMKFSGKVGPGGSGYRRSFTGKPGLIAKLVIGPCRIQLTEESLPATSEA
ncbi:hypothetical protein BK636_02045 [Pseudomonas chlororaphis]|uniref:hypothetical protein n=1 Tax=Pseudomonas chlororaphis TaxID=587753 RepID=UPI000F476E3D|nr:hypothetical protein [Pseudomonas chlororaphis]ROL94154.1 hypothetical protein BK636_02045 [Pseudomonas chlororaphis]WDH25118.1 hypothetical protein PUP50_12870 [Pseudomonas chlororaphis]